MPFNSVILIARGEKPAWYQATATYARASTRTALWQLVNTLIPYFALLALMAYLVSNGYPYVIILILATIAAALFVRIFILPQLYPRLVSPLPALEPDRGLSLWVADLHRL